MIHSLLLCLVCLLVLFTLWYFISKMVPPIFSQILGVIAAVVFIVFACHQFGVSVPGL